MKRATHVTASAKQDVSTEAGLPARLLPMIAVLALVTACGNSGSGSLNVNVVVPATRTATDTPALVPTDTPAPGVPTNTPVPGVPTDTPAPGLPTNTPVPATPTHTPIAGAPTDTPIAGESMTPTETPAAAQSDTPTPTATPTSEVLGGLPDLVPQRIVLVAPTPVGGCINDINDVMLSIQVCVLNQGSAPAGPFDADLVITGPVTVSFTGADANTEVCADAPLVTGAIVFQVDPGDQVVESDEDNNETLMTVERPTLPPICPTPTPVA